MFTTVVQNVQRLHRHMLQSTGRRSRLWRSCNSTLLRSSANA